jgi:SLOG cluster2
MTRPRSADEPEDETEIRDLTLMRQRTTADASMRICIGGDLKPKEKGQRLAPGVIEEAYLSLMAHQPLLIAGGFHGASGMMAKAMLGTLDPGEAEVKSAHFAKPPAADIGSSSADSAKPSVDDGDKRADFVRMVQAFSPTSHFNSRLTNGEYQELLRSTDPDAIVELIMRSVDRTARATITR